MRNENKDRNRRDYQKPRIESARIADVVRGSGVTNFDDGSFTPFLPAPSGRTNPPQHS